MCKHSPPCSCCLAWRAPERWQRRRDSLSHGTRQRTRVVTFVEGTWFGGFAVCLRLWRAATLPLWPPPPFGRVWHSHALDLGLANPNPNPNPNLSPTLTRTLTLTLTVTLRPTAVRQLAESQSALGAVVASDVASRKTWRRRAGPKAVKRWARLVRGKVVGELLGLSIAAMIAPCVGAIVVQLFHLAFWRLGAASARVDAAAEPAPLPPKLARTIATADALVLFFAALGAFGRNAAARGTGAALFGSATLLVSADAVLKARARRRAAAPAARCFRLEDLPSIGVKGRGSNAPQMSTAIRPATATRAARHPRRRPRAGAVRCAAVSRR